VSPLVYLRDSGNVVDFVVLGTDSLGTLGMRGGKMQAIDPEGREEGIREAPEVLRRPQTRSSAGT
jgi:hypothetical protein